MDASLGGTAKLYLPPPTAYGARKAKMVLRTAGSETREKKLGTYL
jgi:FKBP-type peptidyl-prolyl cis-trans isomerase